MSYENAPQTKLVATHCAVCRRPLVDSVSVEVGMGPTCRKRYLVSDMDEADEESRKAANKLIYALAVMVNAGDNPDGVVEALKALFALGFPRVVQAIVKKAATVKIAATDDDHPHGGGRYAVKTPYDEDVVAAMRGIRGRRWDKQGKVNTFPVESKGALWDMLLTHYDGHVGMGPKGPFVVRKPGTKVPVPEVDVNGMTFLEAEVWGDLVVASSANGHDFGCLEDLDPTGKRDRDNIPERNMAVVNRFDGDLIEVYEDHYVNDAERVTQFKLTSKGFALAGMDPADYE